MVSKDQYQVPQQVNDNEKSLSTKSRVSFPIARNELIMLIEVSFKSCLSVGAGPKVIYVPHRKTQSTSFSAQPPSPQVMTVPNVPYM